MDAPWVTLATWTAITSLELRLTPVVVVAVALTPKEIRPVKLAGGVNDRLALTAWASVRVKVPWESGVRMTPPTDRVDPVGAPLMLTDEMDSPEWESVTCRVMGAA